MDRTLGMLVGIAVTALSLSAAPLIAQTPDREEAPRPAPAPTPPPPPPAPAPAPPPPPAKPAPEAPTAPPARPQLRRRAPRAELVLPAQWGEALAGTWRTESNPLATTARA